MANSWNESGTTWSTNRWGTTDEFTLGWGAQAWNDSEWGQLNNAVISLTGVSSTSSIGSVTVSAEINTGWGQDEWGEENWGSSGLTFTLTAPPELQSNVGGDFSWGTLAWSGNSWGGEFVLEVADVMGLTGISSTSTVGS